MISNKAILNTMTSIRLAGDVVSYLSKGSLGTIPKIKPSDSFLRQERDSGLSQDMGNNDYKKPEKERLPKQEEIWVPKNMYSLMLATTANSTSVHFGMNNLCKKHNKLFTLDHLEECDTISGCQDIRKYANKLKDLHITKWDKEDRYHGIALFAYLTV
jgi:hypothetical protein